MKGKILNYANLFCLFAQSAYQKAVGKESESAVIGFTHLLYVELTSMK